MKENKVLSEGKDQPSPGREKEFSVIQPRCLRGCLISSLGRTRRHIPRTQSDPFISAPPGLLMHNAILARCRRKTKTAKVQNEESKKQSLYHK